jgi:alpha-1,2-mannosyltransferase
VVLVVLAGVVGALVGGFTDLDVYRHAGQAVLDRESLTGIREATGLPFTYPAFAAVLMVPLALLPEAVAAGLWTAASVAALSAVLWLVLGELGRARPGWLVAGLAAGSLALEPVWQNLTFGQVNLLLMALVVGDLLRPERRWSGVLLGVAAGVKLTPLVFVLLLLLVGRRGAAVRALVAFAATVLVGLVAVPGAADYWGERLVEARRVGPPALAHNQSAYGALTRVLDQEPPTWLWVGVAAVLAAACVLLAAWWWHRDRVLGTSLGALGMLIASPVAWSHHWVWVVPLVVALWQRSRLVAVATVAVFVARPFVWLPHAEQRELDWSALQHVIGNPYLLCALAVVGWAAGQAARASEVAPAAEPGNTVGGQSHESSHGR